MATCRKNPRWHIANVEEHKLCERLSTLSCDWTARKSPSIPLNVNCRHEIIPILRALQHLYAGPEVREAILQAIASDVNRLPNPKRGRPGMSYWEIVVLEAVRLGCNHNYEEPSDLAQNHRAMRQVMGIGDWDLKSDFPACSGCHAGAAAGRASRKGRS